VQWFIGLRAENAAKLRGVWLDEEEQRAEYNERDDEELRPQYTGLNLA